MNEVQAASGAFEVLAKLAPVGTNLLLLAGLIIVFTSWRKDQKEAKEEMKGIIGKYEGLLEKNASVLTSLAERLE